MKIICNIAAGIIVLLVAALFAGCSSEHQESQPVNISKPLSDKPKTVPQPDADGDGVADIDDAYPNDPFRTAVLPQEFDVGVSYKRELHVALTGNDATGDGSAASPYGTLKTAASHAVPGTRIIMHAGIYPAVGSIVNLQGTTSEPIAIVADGNVVFDPGDEAVVLHFRDPRYVVLQGFTVRNTKVHGINIDDGGTYDTPAEHVIIRNLTFRNIGTGGNHDCLKLSGVNHFLVLNNEFDSCNHGEAVDMVGCHQGVLKGNFIHNIPVNAINTKGGSSDILIQGNRFSDIASRAINAGGHTGFKYYRPIDAPYEGARIRMLANIFERVGKNDGASVSFTGCDHCVFANNTIVEPHSYIVRILQERKGDRFVPSRNGYFINNIVIFNTSDIDNYVDVGDGTAPETFTFGNNLWYALDKNNFHGPDIPSVIPEETGSIIQQNPQIDLASGHYVISLTSPAAGNGRDVPGTISTDYNNVPFTSPIDIGAFKAQ